MSGSSHGNPVPGAGQGGADPSMEDILASIRRILSEDEGPGPRTAPANSGMPAAATPVAAPVQATPPAMPPDDVLMLDESMLVHEPPQPSPAPTPAAAPAPLVATGLPTLHANTPMAALGSFMSASTQPDVPAAHFAPKPVAAPPPAEPPAPAMQAEVAPEPPTAPLPSPKLAPAPPMPLPTLAPAAPPPVPENRVLAKADPMPPADESAAMPALVAPEASAAASASIGTLLRTISAERQAPVYRGGPSIEDVVREEIRPMLKQWLDANLPDMVERIVRAEIERMAGHAKL